MRSIAGRQRPESTALPSWVKPQLTKLVDQPPDGPEWLHEIKFDGYRMHTRLDRGTVRLLTRTGLDWTHKYPMIAAAVASLPAREAYLDGELCGVRPDGTTSFSLSTAIASAAPASSTTSSISAGWSGTANRRHAERRLPSTTAASGEAGGSP
jgi:ATP-dependent DNA ligase